MRLIPKIDDGVVQIPLAIFVLWYLTVYPIIWIWIYAGAMVSNMDTIVYMPGDFVIPVAVAIVVTAVVLYLVAYLVSYQIKRSKVLAERAAALQKGEPEDEIAIERVKTFHFIYKMAMLLGIAITSVGSFAVLVAGVGTVVDFSNVYTSCFYAVMTEIVVFAIFDRFFGRPIADGTFKAKVVDPLEEAIVDQFHKSAEPVAEEASSKALSDEQKAAIAKLLGL